MSSDVVPMPSDPYAPPKWDEISQDVRCPRCDYNLRGLIDPRCPECGLRFRWLELVHSRYRRHPYLFEHHPEREFRAFLRTLVGGLRPRRFWSELQLLQPSYPRRVIGYWLLCGGVLGLAMVFLLAYALALLLPSIVRSVPPGPMRLNVLRSVWEALQLEWPLDVGVFAFIWMAAVIPLLWPWLTYAALLVFQVSMRKARIRRDHVLRCVVYSFDVVFWVSVLAISLIPTGLLLAVVLSDDEFLSLPASFPLLWLPAWAIASYRLHVAYARYLRFDHPFATIVASQIIVFLVAVNLCLPFAW